MASGVVPQQVDISELLDGIDSGDVVLPDFQRDFDWAESDVISLLATVLFGWPAGSLLLMRAGLGQFFRTRPFETAPPQSSSPRLVVLDGQQRLTALYQALRGKGDRVYVLDLKTAYRNEQIPTTAEELEDSISVINRRQWEDQFSLEKQWREQVVPLSVLTSPSDFFQWRDDVVLTIARSEIQTASQRLARLYKNLLGTVHRYSFPSVVLESGLPAEAVSRIFERINRGGLRLSVFDLLVARAYSFEWNLREEWDEARRETSYLEQFLGDDGLPVLQTISLRDSNDVRQGALLQLSRQRIQDEWQRAAMQMETACEWVRNTGVRNPAWLPYKGLLLPLAALVSDFDLSAATQTLETWFWSRSIGLDYDVASSTKISADYRNLRGYFEEGRSFETSTVSELLLIQATRRAQGPLWRAFLSLLVRNGAVDFVSGESLGEQLPGTAPIVLPLARSSTGRGPEAFHLRVLMQVLVSKETARRIRQQGLLPLLSTVEEPERDRRLRSQFLPALNDLSRLVAEPELLLAARARAILEYAVREFPGFQVETGAGAG